VYAWKRLLADGGLDRLRAVSEPDRPARFHGNQLAAVCAAIVKSPIEHGSATEFWTLNVMAVMANASACRIGHDVQRTGCHPSSRVRFAGLRPPLTPHASQNTIGSTHSDFKRSLININLVHSPYLRSSGIRHPREPAWADEAEAVNLIRAAELGSIGLQCAAGGLSGVACFQCSGARSWRRVKPCRMS